MQMWSYYLWVDGKAGSEAINARAAELHGILKYADLMDEACLEKVLHDYKEHANECWHIREEILRNN